MPNYVERRISSLTKETYALILAGGRGSRLYELTDRRAKPATFFGGKFRIIDFPLSNCINSGIRRDTLRKSLVNPLRFCRHHNKRAMAGILVRLMPYFKTLTLSDMNYLNM